MFYSLWLAAVLALVQSTSAQTAGTIHLYTSSGCTGSHMSCGNVPSDGCCTTGGDLFASAFLVTLQQQASLNIFSQVHCTGTSRKANILSCLQPSFAFSAAHWSSDDDKTRRAETDTASEFKDCRRPDTITIVDDDGKETKITVPVGENTDYEHAFVAGDFTKLLKLSKINRNLRFSR